MAEYKESLSTPYAAMVAGGSIPSPIVRKPRLVAKKDIQEDDASRSLFILTKSTRTEHSIMATGEANGIAHLEAEA